MTRIRFTITQAFRKEMAQLLRHAQRSGQVRRVKFFLALLALADTQDLRQVAGILKVDAKTVERWWAQFLLHGVAGAPRKKSSGRPPKLSKTQKQELARQLDAGPSAAGFSAAAWRTPLIQQLIQNLFGVFYNVFYLAQFLKNLGFSWQKAAFVSDHLDELKRHEWRTTIWPETVKQARSQGALLLFGDEASFPQWGTLSYTWARRGCQPKVKTCGKRKGYKVFGLLDYFSGQFFYQGQEGRLNSEQYCAFLAQVLAQTKQPIFLIQDGARYHTSQATREFFAQHAERLTVVQLPTYSPDYNPIEKLWKKLKQEDTHLHYFPTFAALTEKVERALLKFAQTPAAILSLCSLPEELAQAG